MTKLIANSYFKHWPQILTVFIASLAMMNNGSLVAWSSPTISLLIDKDHPLQITYEQASYFTVLPSIATIVAAIPVSMLLDKKERKLTLLFANIPYFLAWILISISNSIWIFYASRLMSGIADACVIAAVSIYIGEVAVPSVRGKWGNVLSLAFYIGLLFTYGIGGFLDIPTTAYIFAGLPVISFILLYNVPESPYFLIMQSKYDEAKKALQWFRQEENVDKELNNLIDLVNRQISESGTYRDIFTIRSNRRAMSAVVFIRLCQQFSGASAFIVYSQTIFNMAGNDISSTKSALICGCIQLLFSIIGAMIVDKLGRRITLFTSAIGCIIVLIFMAIYFYLDKNTTIDLSCIYWFPLVGMIGFLIIFSLGLSIVPNLISGEVFSSSVKGKAMAVNNIVFAAFFACATKLFQVLSEFGLFVPFLFYACTCSIFTIICYFVTPETKNKTLDEIQFILKQ